MAWLMFWHGQYFVAVNGLTLLMFWHSRCFGTFDIIEPLMFWCSRTNAGERQSLRDLKYQPHLYTDCTKTLTAPKHRTHRNTDNAGPKGQLVSNSIWDYIPLSITSILAGPSGQHCRCYGVVDVSVQSVFWCSQCTGEVDI